MGKLSTTETITLPEIRYGSRYADILITGFNAIRTGYFNINFHSDIPFARAVTTYGLDNSSSKFALTTLIIAAIPAVPSIITGTHKCFIKSINLAIDQGAVPNSGEKRPPTLHPNKE